MKPKTIVRAAPCRARRSNGQLDVRPFATTPELTKESVVMRPLASPARLLRLARGCRRLRLHDGSMPLKGARPWVACDACGDYLYLERLKKYSTCKCGEPWKQENVDWARQKAKKTTSPSVEQGSGTVAEVWVPTSRLVGPWGDSRDPV